MKHLIIGTAGHVDHGKTALIKALTNIDCDTHKQEKDRGITINLGFAHLDMADGESVGIIDVPGHKDFIRTMVAGAFGIDIVMLVIAADSGIMPQTREHLDIIETLGVSKGIVVLTKTDLVDEEMVELARLEVTEYLEGTVFEQAPVLGVSSMTGEGIDELKAEISKLIGQVEQRKGAAFFRLYVDRLFNVKGIGFVVTGTVLDGKIKNGDEVFLLPGKNKKLKVKGLQRHGNTVDEVFAGDRAALNLSGLKAEDFHRGMLLSNKELESTSLVDARVTRFDNESRIGIWSSVVFYAGTFECMARMHLLDKDLLDPGGEGIVQLHLEQAAVLMNRDKFIIRNSSNDITLGGGIIIDTKPLHHKKRTPKLIASLQALAEATGSSDRLIDLIKIELLKGRVPMTADEIAEKLNKTAAEIKDEITANPSGDIIIYGEQDAMIVVDRELDRTYNDRVMEEIEAWHQKYPILETGLDTRELIGKLGFTASETGKRYTGMLMNSIKKEGLVAEVKDTWVKTGHEVKLDNKTTGELEWLERKLKDSGIERPLMKDLEAIALEQGIRKEKLKMLLTYLGKQGKVYFFENEFFYTPILDRARLTLLKDLSGKPAGINEKEFRDLLDATKKTSQVLLKIFIHEGIVEKRTFYVLITEKGKNSL